MWVAASSLYMPAACEPGRTTRRRPRSLRSFRRPITASGDQPRPGHQERARGRCQGKIGSVSGILPLGDIPCAVLDDSGNTRVLIQAGFLTAIGRFATPKSVQDEALVNLPTFLRAKNLEPFISNELMRSSAPIIFETEKGGGARLMTRSFSARHAWRLRRGSV